MTVFPQNYLQFQCKPYQNTNSIFHRTGVNNPKICMETNKQTNKKKNRKAKIVFKMRTKLEILCFLISTYTSKLVIKIIWYWNKTRHIDQWSRTENPKVSQHLYGQLMYEKGSKDIHWGENILFNKQCWENWMAICKRTNWTTFPFQVQDTEAT